MSFKNFVTTVREYALNIGYFSIFAALFFVPWNKPLVNLAIALAWFSSILGVRVANRFKSALQHPVVLSCLGWLLILLLSAGHSWLQGGAWPASGSAVFAWCYPLLFASLLETDAARRRALWAFGLGVGLVLLVSWGQLLGAFPQHDPSSSFRYTVVKEYTQQGLEFLVLASWGLSCAKDAKTPIARYLLWLMTVLAIAAVLFLLQSRTAYLVCVFWAGYWVLRQWGGHWKSKSSLVAGGIFVLILLALLSTPNIQQRLITAVEREVQNYVDQREPTSTGIRMELWRQTIPIVANSPLVGHGLGQWKVQYLERIQGLPHVEEFSMGHPHQEMLLILAEEGVLGGLIYLALLIALWRYARQLETPYKDFYSCLLLIYLVAGLANCLWVDFTHRHMFILALGCIPMVGVQARSLQKERA